MYWVDVLLCAFNSLVSSKCVLVSSKCCLCKVNYEGHKWNCIIVDCTEM